MKAPLILAQNIDALLRGRHLTNHDLAQYCRHTDTWISNVLSGQRNISLPDLDHIAAFFGIETYQLFQPGISQLTERRKSDRRSGRERRLGHSARAMLSVGPVIDARRGRTKPDMDSSSRSAISSPSESKGEPHGRRRRLSGQPPSTPIEQVAGALTERHTQDANPKTRAALPKGRKPA